MNIIKHRVFTLEIDVWEPMGAECEREIDTLLNAIKTKALLAHCGNVKFRQVSEERL